MNIDTIQCVTFLLAILIVIFNLKRVKLYPKKWHLRFPVLFLMFHFFVFYVISIANKYIYCNYVLFVVLDIWSDILRFHSIATYLALEIYGFLRDRKEGGNIKYG